MGVRANLRLAEVGAGDAVLNRLKDLADGDGGMGGAGLIRTSPSAEHGWVAC